MTNPAKDIIEPYAFEIVRRWVGYAGTIHDLSKTNGVDFKIDYHDGRVGVGDIVWNPDSARESLWSEIFNKHPDQKIQLTQGSGVWGVYLRPSTNLKEFVRKIQAFIDECNAAGVGSMRTSYFTAALETKASRLGIESMHQIADMDGNWVMFGPSAVVEVIDTGPNSVVYWVQDVLVSRYADVPKKLAALEADERHAVVVAGDATPMSVDYIFNNWQEPTIQPTVAGSITHVWTISRYPNRTSLLWRRDHGWQTVYQFVRDPIERSD